LSKLKIHELAKELNTTSKRLIEKLHEIGIRPKSHMSTLEEDEIERLYKHIGVVKRPKEETETTTDTPEVKPDPAEVASRKNAPRIIRKREVIIHDEPVQDENKGKKERRSYVRKSDGNEGLMAGFTRGKDSSVANVRKRSKSESVQSADDNKQTNKAKPGKTEDRLQQPVNDILSVRKVVKKPEKLDAESIKAKEQEIMQKELLFEETGIQAIKKVEKVPQPETRTEDEKQNDATAGVATKAETEDLEDTKKSSESKESAEESDKATGAADKVEAEDSAPLKKAERVEKQATGEATDKPQSKEERKSEVVAQDDADVKVRAAGKKSQGGKQDQKDAASGEPGRQNQAASKVRDGSARQQSQQRTGGFKSRDSRDGGQQSGQGRASFGRSAAFDKDKADDSRRDGNRSVGKNKPLNIPKPVTPLGTAEEKVPTRGERRSFQEVAKMKEEKKELKKTQPRVASSNTGRNKNLRKKLDNVVGHKAKVTDMMSDDFVIDTFYNDPNEAINTKRAERRIRKSKQKEKYIPPKAVLTDITINETLTVKELAEALKKTAAEVIKKLFLMGITATQNQEIDFETAEIIGDEFGVKVHKAVVISQEDILFDDTEDNDEELESRAPVVVVMGHVDHGKTSLLDAIRSSNTAEQEAGGITQTIGAYTVNLNGRDITFLDTPGHEAFTAMRARGAQVTDIAILVVAADDGVMPQTVEAINHAKAAGISIIVAINKIDRPNANPDRVKQELSEHGLLIEEWGGDVIAVPVSAKKRENIDQLLEMVLLTADIMELKANPNKQAKGTVIEAELDKNKGPVATLLVQRGTLRVGDAILSGSTFGHIRSMVNDRGKKIDEAGPSMAVEILGLSDVPAAGDIFYVVEDEKVAKQLAEKRKDEMHQRNIGRVKVSLDDLFTQIQQGNMKELNLIVKADVHGSVEAIRSSMEKLSNDEVKVKVIHGAVGAIIEADIRLAEVSNAIIIGFNVRPTAQVTELAKEAEVDMRLYRVIYDAIEDIEKAMKGLLDPVYKEVVDGHAEVRQLYKVSSLGTIAGSYVIDGKILRNSEVRIVRDGIVVKEGKLSSLKRFKDDVREVASGYECGIMVENYNDIKEGDIIESFHMEEVER
jgi:translation initiation factor IF-2